MAKRHILRIKKDYFDLMNENIKTLDVRVGYPNILEIKEGDTVSFENYSDNCFDVVRITAYSDLANMLDNEDSQLIMPGKTKYELLHILQEIYPEEKERLGVYVIEYKKHQHLTHDYKIISVSSIASKNRINFSSIASRVYAATDSWCEIHHKHFNWYWSKVIPGILLGTHEILVCTIGKSIAGVVIIERRNKRGEICIFSLLDDYFESDILMYLVKGSFNFLKTNKPHVIIPENKLYLFTDIISKYSWKKTNEFLSGYYDDSNKAYVFN